MFEFLSGSMMMASIVVAVFFFRFWKSTQDQLFLWFGWSFSLLAFERIALVATGAPVETKPYIYGIRLLAFCLIIMAIVSKNRREEKRHSKLHPSEA